VCGLSEDSIRRGRVDLPSSAGIAHKAELSAPLDGSLQRIDTFRPSMIPVTVGSAAGASPPMKLFSEQVNV